MVREDWENINVLKTLMEEVRILSPQRHFNNPTSYVNEAVREKIDRDRQILKEVKE